MNFDKKEKILLALYSAIFMGGIVLLVLGQKTFSSSGNRIAEVVVLQGDSQAMGAKDISWRPLVVSSSLSDGDKLFTQEDSLIQIKFDNGTVIEVEELTLVTLNEDELIVNQGFLKVISTKKEVKVNGKKITASAKSVGVRRKKEKKRPSALISVIPGQSLESKALSSALKEVPQKPISTPTIVSSFEAKEDLTAYDELDDQLVDVELPEEDFSEVLALKEEPKEPIIPLPPKECVLPKEYQAKIDWDGSDPSELSLFMRTENNPSDYVLELTGSEKRLILLKKTLVKRRQSWDYLDPRRPMWVKVSCKDNGPSSWREVDLPYISAVTLNQQIIYREIDGNSADQVISWDDSKKAKWYRLYIYVLNGKRFKEIKKFDTSQLEILISNLEIGEYYYNIIPYDRYQRPGEISELGFIKLENQ